MGRAQLLVALFVLATAAFAAGAEQSIGPGELQRVADGPSASTAENPPMAGLFLNVNLLGILQFGPTVELGIRLAEDLYLSPHLRLDGLGALNWILFSDYTYLYTPALGLGIQHFPPIDLLSPNRLYYGGGLEIEGAGEIPFEEPIVNVYANAGYRWRWPARRRFMNAGLHLGISYDIEWEELMPFGMAELSFGWDLRGAGAAP